MEGLMKKEVDKGAMKKLCVAFLSIFTFLHQAVFEMPIESKKD